MKINIPDFFHGQEKFNHLEIDDISVIDYKVHSLNEKIYAYCNTNLLIVVLKGKKLVKLLDTEMLISSGEVAFIKMGNYIMNQIIDLEGFSFESIVVCLSDDFIGNFAKDYQTLLKGENLHRIDAGNHYFRYQMSATVQKEVESLLLHLETRQAYSKEILKLKIHEIFLNLINDDKSFFSILYGLSMKGKNDLKAYMDENYDKPHSMEEHARNLGMSLTSFKRNFSKVFSDTPNNWINKKRLDKAAFLLSTTDYTITEICFLVGFESLSHFIKLFKNTYGLTPGHYKKKINMDFNDKKLV